MLVILTWFLSSLKHLKIQQFPMHPPHLPQPPPDASTHMTNVPLPPPPATHPPQPPSDATTRMANVPSPPTLATHPRDQTSTTTATATCRHTTTTTVTCCRCQESIYSWEKVRELELGFVKLKARNRVLFIQMCGCAHILVCMVMHLCISNQISQNYMIMHNAHFKIKKKILNLHKHTLCVCSHAWMFFK